MKILKKSFSYCIGVFLILQVLISIFQVSAVENTANRKLNRNRVNSNNVQSKNGIVQQDNNGNIIIDSTNNRDGNVNVINTGGGRVNNFFEDDDDENNGINFNQKFGFSTGNWWDGLNVCKKTKNTTSQGDQRNMGISTYTTCKNEGYFHECEVVEIRNGIIKRTSVIYGCCRGFQRSNYQRGCPTAIMENISTLDVTLIQNNLNRLVDLFTLENLKTDYLSNPNINVTLFVPYLQAGDTSGIMNQLSQQNVLQINPATVNLANNLKNILMGHIVPQLIDEMDLRLTNELVPVIGGNNKIFIDTYGLRSDIVITGIRNINIVSSSSSKYPLFTANCVPFVSNAIYATNGIMYNLTGIMPLVNQKLLDIISSFPGQFSIVAQIFKRTGIEQMISQATVDKRWTLILPTDAALNQLDSQVLNSITADNSPCSISFARSLVLPRTFCSAGLQYHENVFNMNGEQLNFRLNASGILNINGKANIIQKDLLATDGVIHVVDSASFTQYSSSLIDQIKQQGGFSQFTDLLSKSNVVQTLRTMQNYTIFVPSNDAMDQLSATLKNSINSDSQALINFLDLHIIPQNVNLDQNYGTGALTFPTLQNGQSINIINDHKFMSSRLYAQCAPINLPKLKSCDGIAYTIPKVLVSANSSVLQILENDPRFSTFYSLIKISNQFSYFQTMSSNTILAPTNDAFLLLPQNTLNSMKSNQNKLNNFINNYIIEEPICCTFTDIGGSNAKFGNGGFPFNTGIPMFRKSNDGSIRVNGVVVETCDMMATNGNIVQAIQKTFQLRTNNPFDVFNSPNWPFGGRKK